MTDVTAGFIKSIFRIGKPVITSLDFNNPDVWVCDLLNQDQDLANEYILFKLEDAASDDGRLAFLYNSRACFRYALEELKSFQQDPTTGWAPTCCGDPYNRSVEENIKIYESALNAVDCAICHIQETQELTCSTNEEVAPKCKENTTARQTLALYYLAKHLGIWGNIDKARLEDFAFFFTGKDRSDIHKKFRNPIDNKKDPKEQRKDFKFVRDQFQNLGLKDIVDMINREMP